MFDLVIRGERVVTPQGVEPREIAVKDGVIAALGAPGTFAAAQAAHVIDAGPAVVMPGGIDPHVHCAWYIPPMRPGDPPGTSGSPARASRAALYGGTTTLIDFAACAAAKVPGAPSAAMTPSFTAISRGSTPCGVTTRSPRITRSNMRSPRRPELRSGPAASRPRAPAR